MVKQIVYYKYQGINVSRIGQCESRPSYGDGDRRWRLLSNRHTGSDNNPFGSGFVGLLLRGHRMFWLNNIIIICWCEQSVPSKRMHYRIIYIRKQRTNTKSRATATVRGASDLIGASGSVSEQTSAWWTHARFSLFDSRFYYTSFLFLHFVILMVACNYQDLYSLI